MSQLLAWFPSTASQLKKKLARAADKKKVQMIPLKDLAAITTFEHGANTPVGIYEKKGYPIYFDCSAQQQGEIIISSGQIGRSVLVNAEAVAKLVHASFADSLKLKSKFAPTTPL